MIRVDALYRYPVKGFTPEKRDSLVIQADGRVQGDRSLVFRFADALEPEDATYPKSRGLALMTFPSLARVALTFDDGPTPGTTEKILEVLRDHGSTATFFVLSNRATRHPGLLAEVVREEAGDLGDRRGRALAFDDRGIEQLGHAVNCTRNEGGNEGRKSG